MKKLASLMALCLLATVCGVAVAGRAPSAVQREVARIFGKKAPAIEHERKAGVDYYEAARKTEIEVVLTADGKVHEVGVDIPLALVPQPARAAARKALGANPSEAEVLIRGGVAVYELEGRIGKGPEREVVVTADGRVESNTVEADEDGENDEGDEDD